MAAMADQKRVAVVTGGNRGIGLEIGKQLAARGLTVVLGSRDEAAGKAAAASLGGDVTSRPLDVTRDDSIEALAAWLGATFGGLDVLVNNAGIAMDGFDARVARETIAVNFTGVVRVTDRLLPLMRPGGRVVNVTSGLGDTGDLPAALRDRLHADALGRDVLFALMRDFVDGVAAGNHTALGWPSSAYRVSKMGLNAFTHILGRELADDPRGILANAACPGWVKTRMGGQSAPRSLEQGASGIVWAATLGPGGPNGGFFRDGKAIAW